MQAALRRAPGSAAPRFPAAARASRVPEPTLELRTGRTQPGRRPAERTLPGPGPDRRDSPLGRRPGCGDPGTLQPAGRAPHLSALTNLARGFGLHGAWSPGLPPPFPASSLHPSRCSAASHSLHPFPLPGSALPLKASPAGPRYPLGVLRTFMEV